MKLRREAAAQYHETTVRVRFNEVDSYKIAWHGHYVSWMEAGRNDLAGRFGIDPAQVEAFGYLAPVVALELKFLRPARFGEELRVRTWLAPAATATLEFRSEIVGEDGGLAAAGRTVHAITDLNGVIQYLVPPVIAARVETLLGQMGTK